VKPRGAPPALQTLDRPGEGPRLIFPPDGATVVADGFGAASRGFVLAAGGQGLAWYVDGAPVAADPVSGKPIWRPPGPGFYRISVVDAAGRAAFAKVRVAGG
jgi:penicillin-binding protein 1C